jgi:hypothetical protein
MWNAESLCDPAGVLDVLAGAAGALAARSPPSVVELKRYAHDVVPFASE